MIYRVILLLAGGFWLIACTGREQKQDQMVDFRRVQYDPAYSLRELTAAIDRDPRHAAHYFKRAQFYLEAQKYSAALQDIAQAIALDEEKGEYFFRRAQILRAGGNYSAALTAATRADQLKYRHPDLAVMLGELYLYRKDYGRALQYISAALEETPQNEYLYFFRGLALAQTGDTLAAIRSFKSAVRRDPQLMAAYPQLAKIFLALREPERAEVYVRAGRRRDSVNAELWYYQGEIYSRRQQNDSAYVSYQKAVQFDSLLHLARYRLGLLAFSRRDYPAAARALAKTLPFSDNKPQAHLVLGESYEQTGQLAKALPHYQWVYTREPQNLKAMWGVRRTMYHLYKLRRDSLKTEERRKHDSLLAILQQRDS